MTSQPKINRRRCKKAIIRKMILPMIVKGLTIPPLFPEDFGFFYKLPFVLHTIIASFKRECFRKRFNRVQCIFLVLFQIITHEKI